MIELQAVKKRSEMTYEIRKYPAAMTHFNADVAGGISMCIC